MYGSEHSFLLHSALMIGSWLVYLVICFMPFALIFIAYWFGLRRGRKMERARHQNEDDGPSSSA
jgi:hypothetical protein